MQIDVTGDDTPLTDFLREHTRNKIMRVFERSCEHPARCHVILSTVRHEHHAEVVVNHNGRNYRAAGVADGLRTAIDAAVAKLRRQLDNAVDRQRPRTSTV